WDPRSLPIQACWFYDGPLLPIEFTRQSGDGRITLVIVPGVRPVRSLWVPMLVTDVESARIELAEREEIPEAHRLDRIGYWTADGAGKGPMHDSIARWAFTVGMDGVIWTALPPRFKDEERVPSINEVLSYLREASPETRQHAEE